MQDPKTFLPLNPREFLVLLALSDTRRYGYEIVRAVEEESGGDVRLDPANLYRILKRLIRDGLVRDAGTRATKDLPNERRRFYEITELGRGVLSEELKRLDRLIAGAKVRNLIPRKHRTP